MATLRVHNLAKDLGVTSKAILEKCRAEGLDLKNHMSTLSAGLAATIREWFSEGAHTSTVERTARVKLDKVRRKTKPKKKEEHVEAEVETEAETAVAVAVAEPEEAEEAKIEEKTDEKAEADVEVAVAVAEPETKAEAEVEAAPEETGKAKKKTTEKAAEKAAHRRKPPKKGKHAKVEEAEEAPVAEVEAETEKESGDEGSKVAAEAEPAVETEKKTDKRVAKEFVDLSPPKPKKVKPVEYKPEPAKLKGPKVVRVERPDYLEPPRRARPRSRPRPAAGPAGGGGPGGGGGGGGPQAPVRDVAPSRRNRTRRRVGPGAAGGETEEQRRRRLAANRHGRGAREFAGQVRQWQSRGGSAPALPRRARHRASVSTRRRFAVQTGPSIKEGKVEIEAPITIRTLSEQTGVKANDLIRKLMTEMETIANINQVLDKETAESLMVDYNIELVVKGAETRFELLEKEFETRKVGKLEFRAPVVTFLGHVDHGKTSLLDKIRSTAVADGEAGGITQHIRAHRLDIEDKHVTFLDTPGHRAFTAMRARGANMTDVVVLVVAADDGVMPQTEEAISHAKAAEVPIVVALNKIDLPGAKEGKDRILGQLAEHGLQPHDWGGDVEIIETSATTGEGIDKLVELLSLEAEMLELKADPAAPARGQVIEAEMTTTLGPSAGILIQDGTLRVGDVVAVGPAFGRVRTMTDDKGREIKEAGPSIPVRISGIDAVPAAADTLFVLDDLGRAKEVAQEFKIQRRREELAPIRPRTIDISNLGALIAAGDLKELELIVKADVQGSINVLRKELNALSTDEVAVRILHAQVGGITEADVSLAEASGAIIIGFYVVAEDAARKMAIAAGVEIRLHKVIYNVTDEIKKAMIGMLPRKYEQRSLGRLEVRQTFKVGRRGVIGGCIVNEGTVNRDAHLRLLRDSIIIRDDVEVESLRRFKDDVREVRAGLECGLRLEKFNDIKVGDVLEAYEEVEVERTL